MTPEEVAAGALEIAAANQVFGIRQVTTARGREPGNYAMVAFGGAGGLFATEVADFLGMTHRHLAARSRQPLRLRPARLGRAARLHPHHRPPAVGRPIGGEILAAWNELARRRHRRHQGGGHPARARSRSAASPTSAISARATRCRSTIPAELGDEDAIDAHVEGVPQGARPHLRLPLRGRAGRRAGQSPHPGGGRAAPAGAQAGHRRARAGAALRDAASLLAADRAGSNARSTAGPSSPSARRSPDRRSSRNTARPSSCRRAGPCTSDAYGNLIVEKSAERSADAGQGPTERTRSSARSSSR